MEQNKKDEFPPTDEQMDIDPSIANNCIEIYIYQRIAWRFCHRLKDSILKLKQTISYGALETVPGVDKTTLMGN